MAERGDAQGGAAGDRRKFRREGEEKRREALIAAAIALVAEGGTEAATARAVAERAGVTAGLIRHYFRSREDLLRAAYDRVMAEMFLANTRALEGLPDDPAVRLAAFVAASLRPPVVDPTTVALWAGFIHMAQREAGMHETHMATYLGYRDRLQALIAALPRPATAERLRADSIACNAVIDGLWLEASALPEAFGPGEIERLGLASVAAILGVALPGDA